MPLSLLAVKASVLMVPARRTSKLARSCFITLIASNTRLTDAPLEGQMGWTGRPWRASNGNGVSIDLFRLRRARDTGTDKKRLHQESHHGGGATRPRTTCWGRIRLHSRPQGMEGGRQHRRTVGENVEQ